jgi:hypothetical protein
MAQWPVILREVAMTDDEFNRRLSRQARISIRVSGLRDRPIASTTDTTPEQRLALVEELTRESWLLTGRSLPSYRRGEMPVLVRVRKRITGSGT